MPVASGVSVDDIFFGQLCQFYRLALSLCGDKLTAEQTLMDAYERARAADHVQPGWHIRWVKHSIIRSCLDSIRTLQADETPGSSHAPRWSDSLSIPFRAALPRILFVLRVWEGNSLADVCRYCSLSRAHAAAMLSETWMQIRTQPACLTEFATALIEQESLKP
jgi:hypothetical protein